MMSSAPRTDPLVYRITDRQVNYPRTLLTGRQPNWTPMTQTLLYGRLGARPSTVRVLGLFIQISTFNDDDYLSVEIKLLGEVTAPDSLFGVAPAIFNFDLDDTRDPTRVRVAPEVEGITGTVEAPVTERSQTITIEVKEQGLLFGQLILVAVRNATRDKTLTINYRQPYVLNNPVPGNSLTGFKAKGKNYPRIILRMSVDALRQANLAQIAATIVDDRPHPIEPSPYRQAVILPFDGLTTTNLSLYIPDFESVIVGDSCDLGGKILVLIVRPEDNQLLLRITTYGVLKYLLSWLLYGDFSLRYLLRSFNHRFFQDLAASRYRRFIAAFTTPELQGLVQYFV